MQYYPKFIIGNDRINIIKQVGDCNDVNFKINKICTWKKIINI